MLNCTLHGLLRDKRQEFSLMKKISDFLLYFDRNLTNIVMSILTQNRKTENEMFKMFLTGAIGQDARVNQINPERVAINFSVGNNKEYRKDDVKITETRWVDCVKYVNVGKEKIAEYLTKGKMVAIEGEPEADAYVDKDGEVVGKLRLVVDDITFLSGKKDG